MKIRNLFAGAAAALAMFVGCQPQEENLGTPDISISTNEMAFEASGGDKEMTVNATRDWKVETDADWVVVSPESGAGSMEDQKVTVSVLENTGMDRSADLKFTIGMKSKYLTVSQAGPGGSVEALIVYSNDFDKEEATKTYGSSGGSWPYLDQFEGWKNATGTGAANVTYNFSGVSARNNSNSNGSDSDYSGSGMNNIFFGANAYFSTNNIALNGATSLELTFGTEKYSQTDGSKFTNSEYHIWLSADGTKWVELTDYTFAGTADGRWNVATANFTVPAGTENLSICMQVDVASAYRLDDFNLVSSTSAGTAVDFTQGVEKDFTAGGSTGGETPTPPTPPAGGSSMTIAEVLASSGALASGSTIEGIVISNMDLNNLTSKKGMYIQDETAGLQFYLAANHTFAFGDKVQIDLSGVTVGEYNGAVQVSGLALDKITKISSGNTVTPKTVSIDEFLANKYEGQYIAIEGVQVADADLSKTFVMDGGHTSITVEDASGKSFAIFSSKYASYGTQTVPQGSGTIKGISSISKGAMQIIFAQNSDFAGLTGTRFDGTEVTPPTGGGDEGGETPVAGNRADFETLSRTSSYGASTTTDGWVLTNCAVQEGGEKDSNPVYILLGKVPGTDTWAKAACMNGKTSASGTIESPELSGGCGTLSFDYANIFTESNGVNFKIEVIQNGAVVKTIVVDEDSITKMTKYTFTEEVNVSGSFKLKFTNLCPTNDSSKNKDRVSIWNLVWTSVE